jgi:hypothetical protein
MSRLLAGLVTAVVIVVAAPVSAQTIGVVLMHGNTDSPDGTIALLAAAMEGAGGFHEPARGRPVRRGCRHVVGAGIDHGEAAEQHEQQGYEDGGDDGAHVRLSQNHSRTPKAKRTSPVLSLARRAKLAVWPNFPS